MRKTAMMLLIHCSLSTERILPLLRAPPLLIIGAPKHAHIDVFSWRRIILLQLGNGG